MKLIVQFWLCFFITSFAVAQGPCNNATSITYQGYKYDLAEIGGQCWFAENLRSQRFRNGDQIPALEEDVDWSTAMYPANCVFGNYGPYENSYGRLYNWYAVIDGRGLCPNGFHVPSRNDFVELERAIGISAQGSVAGPSEEYHLNSHILYMSLLASPDNMPSWEGTNQSGFNLLPGGARGADGIFGNLGSSTILWTATPKIDETAFNVLLMVKQDNKNEGAIGVVARQKRMGFYVRCLKDSE